MLSKLLKIAVTFFNFQLEEFERMIGKSHKITTTKESILFLFVRREKS